ncbi:hypothetical protein COS81_02440 [candidate division WWE3 bacterium CG06_land_8_20_14_3_00_42_16]|uniref:Uncharacterized protein n=1 Tax=candidate division WWE3 bacterium CG06_land_8_20_14_3_00_42_16 TaxID=1975083 RepID=A0A2M7AN89_UNCKA|nr:MAG: hypothetical protein COS81_02440 [candidate division WWE3 bacterium CG06_land_8_20_14_3_00_42_16]
MSKYRSKYHLSEYHYRPQASLRKKEIKAYRKTFLIILLTFGFLSIIYLWGIPFISNLYNFWGAWQANPNSAETNNLDLVNPPQINPLPKLTNQSQLTISGQAQANDRIRLLLSGNEVDTAMADQDGNFIFENVTLHEGENNFSLTAVTDGNESQPVNLSVVSDKTPPTLTLEKPADGQKQEGVNSTVTIEGITEPDAFLVVNEHQVIVENTGKFSYRLNLAPGENKIKIIAKDEAGNETTAEKTVFYTPSAKDPSETNILE